MSTNRCVSFEWNEVEKLLKACGFIGPFPAVLAITYNLQMQTKGREIWNPSPIRGKRDASASSLEKEQNRPKMTWKNKCRLKRRLVTSLIDCLAA